MNLPDRIRIRCDQNRIFGCGRLVTAYPSYRRLPGGAVVQHASAWCPCCLPLAKVRTLHPA